MSQNASRDERLLIDCLLGFAADDEAREVRDRLPREEPLRRLKAGLENAFAALDRLPEAEALADLASRTAGRVALLRAGEGYIAQRETARPWAGGTFNLRELAVVGACVLLLVVVFVPSLRQARRASLQNQCASNAGLIGTALGAYASQNREYLPSVLDEKAQWLRANGQPAVSNSASLFVLVRSGLAAAPVFQCPAVGGGSFAVNGQNDFPGAEYVQYSYQHPRGPEGPLRRDRFAPAEAEAYAVLADQTPLFSGASLTPDKVRRAVSVNHAGSGHNVVYLNGAVRWADQPEVGVRNDNIFLSGSLVNYQGNEGPSGRLDTFLLPAYSQRP